AACRVPVEHLEIDAAPATLDGDRGKPRDHSAAHAMSPRIFHYIQIFEIEARAAEPSREPLVKKRAAGRLAVHEGEDRLEMPLDSKAPADQVGLGRHHRVWRALEHRQFAD